MKRGDRRKNAEGGGGYAMDDADGTEKRERRNRSFFLSP